MHLTDRKPNIVFVVLDTHRWDRLGCYGYPRGTSPNLDSFAEEATLFDRGVAPAQWTIPSHASMFTGEPPSVHGALQADDVLHPRFKTLAEHLSEAGYRTVGFCNNPLVGVLENGLRRGFDAFYNYGGAFPAGLAEAAPRGALGRVLGGARDSLRRVARPIQNAFATSNALFQGALDPFWVPIWTWIANFKGNTPRSIRDVARFLERRTKGAEGPQFVFVNLMETHLPYTPPKRFLQAFAPSYCDQGAARDFVRRFNRRAADWFTPPSKPFSELEAHALGQMYDAEVAYQDHLLAQVLEVLDRAEHRDNTMVVVAADHGEMLGEHRLMGHAFGVHEELVHVPLLIRFPGQTEGKRVPQPVLATRLFHTVLEAAGVETWEDAAGKRLEPERFSLERAGDNGRDPGSAVVTEAYAPIFALNVMEARKAELIEELHCRATHRALYEASYKLLSVEGVEDRLYSLGDDPQEAHSLDGNGHAGQRQALTEHLASFLETAKARKPDVERLRATNADEAVVRQRLRHLGYLE